VKNENPSNYAGVLAVPDRGDEPETMTPSNGSMRLRMDSVKVSTLHRHSAFGAGGRSEQP
jgi:hypothetical protein